ncbi:sensor histidine kinase [Glycomyces harbinensis]|uniref:histidine kinase n=1 Tax=Glycomyces harbinensis TaxID=58114 RepID=A0A1G7DXY0_9ACTN|nr:histidine kinase [Glycomyces harbinensis]SDE56313.1 Signal transduction histidine kinase [Glycomyces harbinensis]
MTSETAARSHPVRALISYVIAAAPPGRGDWRWRLSTTFAIIGPGSVPLGLTLFAIQYHMMRVDYLVEWGVVPAAATGAAVVLSRFRPVEAWLLVMFSLVFTVIGAQVISTIPWPLTVANMLTLLLALFALGRDRRVWVGVLAWLSYLAVGSWASWLVTAQFVIIRTDPVNDPYGNPAPDNLILGSLLGALAFLTGMTVRIWRQGRARVAEEERVAESERHRRRLLEERTRIARELHDIVAHHMSVITVQASTAEYRLTGLGEEAKAEFRSISDQARESLAEMRRLLGVLRREDESVAREPLPGPEGLRGLAEAVDRSGTPVALRVGEMPEDLPETLALTVFRVAQEGLSNVVRHAPGAPTTVEVTAGPREVTVTVENGRPPEGEVAPEAHGSGLGLVGMRERVTLDGGTLETGPTAEGGFRVHAVLPIEDRQNAEESP